MKIRVPREWVLVCEGKEVFVGVLHKDGIPCGRCEYWSVGCIEEEVMSIQLFVGYQVLMNWNVTQSINCD